MPEAPKLLVTVAASGAVCIPNPDLTGTFVCTDGTVERVATASYVEADVVADAFNQFIANYPGVADLKVVEGICTGLLKAIKKCKATVDERIQLNVSATEGTIALYQPEVIRTTKVYKYPCEVNI